MIRQVDYFGNERSGQQQGGWAAGAELRGAANSLQSQKGFEFQQFSEFLDQKEKSRIRMESIDLNANEDKKMIHETILSNIASHEVRAPLDREHYQVQKGAAQTQKSAFYDGGEGESRGTAISGGLQSTGGAGVSSRGIENMISTNKVYVEEENLDEEEEDWTEQEGLVTHRYKSSASQAGLQSVACDRKE